MFKEKGPKYSICYGFGHFRQPEMSHSIYTFNSIVNYIQQRYTKRGRHITVA